MKKYIFLIAITTLISGCASLQSVSLTSIPNQKNQPVKAKTEKLIILGFNFDNNFVDQLTDDLKRQCPQGEIKGILTKDEVIQYFGFFVWKRVVSADGYCVSAQTRASASIKE